MDTAQKIIVFCFLLQGVCSGEFSISLPEKINALSGSCVIIQCRFEIQGTFDTNLTESSARGLWLKDGHEPDKHLVFNSSDPKPNHFKGEMMGKLNEKNCTTVFYDVSSNHDGKYYFRIESGDLKYTYIINTSTISVTESPPKPTVKLYELQDQQQVLEVLEGRSVSLSCSAETLCSSPPPTLTWSSTHTIPLSESSRQQELISDLNFTATRRHHRCTFSCTLTYRLQDKSRTAQDNITLHVQYAPKISPSSSCDRTGVTECVCDGNPSPEVEWRLSGRPVTDSSNTFISEERLGSTGLRSSITLHQSLTHTSALECVCSNTHGTARKLLQLPPPVTCLDLSSVITGGAVAALVFMMLCAIITCFCVRKVNRKLLSIQGSRSGQNTDEAASPENQDDSVYVMMSPAEASLENPGSLFSFSVDFKSPNPQSREFGSYSAHTDYTMVQHCAPALAETENSTGESSRGAESQGIVRADVITKQTESKSSGEEPLADNSQIYATVKPHIP